MFQDLQPQTFVSKHDLALLHKKIIATELVLNFHSLTVIEHFRFDHFSLIVQKYQEANKALVALQVENEQLRQQIDQITKYPSIKENNELFYHFDLF